MKRKAYRFKFLIVVVIVSLLSSCKPMSKESYLESYEEFIIDVRQNGGEFDEGDWADVDVDYIDYSEVWYEEFKSELTVKEEMQIASWNVQYNALKGMSEIRGFVDVVFDDEDGLLTFFNEQYGDDVEALTEDLEKRIIYYQENQMEEDLKTLKDAIKSASDSIPELVELLRD